MRLFKSEDVAWLFELFLVVECCVVVEVLCVGVLDLIVKCVDDNGFLYCDCQRLFSY